MLYWVYNCFTETQNTVISTNFDDQESDLYWLERDKYKRCFATSESCSVNEKDVNENCIQLEALLTEKLNPKPTRPQAWKTNTKKGLKTP